MHQAYISSVNDDTSVTVITKSSDLPTLEDEACKHNLRVKPIPVYGRFHHQKHSHVVDKFTDSVLFSLGLQFPKINQLQTPVRDTATGHIISTSSLSRLALLNTLVNAMDWYGTVRSSVEQLSKPTCKIAVAGFIPCVPQAITRNQNIKVFALSSDYAAYISLMDASVDSQKNDSGPNIIRAHAVESKDELSKYPEHTIAIVGVAGRFPGAESVDELWELLKDGRTMVEPAPIDRFKLPQTGAYADKKWWGNFLKDSDAFDHKFFGKSSREAVAWDPQQRILLEVVYEALESAGYFGASNPQPSDYGCYIGAVMSNWYDNMSCYPASAYGTVGVSRCFHSGQMSHYFGWTGPSLSIDTACSSSLVAIHTACKAIWSGECSRAVAGGTNVFASPFDYLNLAAAGFLSPSGQCKPFDANADGYCRGEAVSVIVLKRLSDAIADNDHIHGVIVGSALNQNHNFGAITAPNSDSQIDLYKKVVELSQLKAEEVTYVEAHGTGSKHCIPCCLTLPYSSWSL